MPGSQIGFTALAFFVEWSERSVSGATHLSRAITCNYALRIPLGPIHVRIRCTQCLPCFVRRRAYSLRTLCAEQCCKWARGLFAPGARCPRFGAVAPQVFHASNRG
jgi:hypothetical protein